MRRQGAPVAATAPPWVVIASTHLGPPQVPGAERRGQVKRSGKGAARRGDLGWMRILAAGPDVVACLGHTLGWRDAFARLGQCRPVTAGSIMTQHHRLKIDPPPVA
jgi:hypothetical protein